MRSLILFPLALLVGGVALGEASEAPALAGAELRLSENGLPVYRQPTARSPLRGRTAARESFRVLGRVAGPGCKSGWGQVEAGGYVCLDATVPSTAEPATLPRLVAYDMPEPDQWADYVKSGSYPREAEADSTPLLPFIYGKAWRRWTAPVYQSAAHYERGAAPLPLPFDAVRKYHFTGVQETKKGRVLTRPDGTVMPEKLTHIYTVSRFQGRDLEKNPLPAGMLPAWAFNYEKSIVRTAPRKDAPEGKVLQYHEQVMVDAAPADTTGRWWRIPDALGPGVDGYVDDQVDVRHWEPMAPPKEVGPDTFWIDVDTDQQVLALLRGTTPLYVTLVSTGEGDFQTPLGIYRIIDKVLWNDMQSRPDAEEPYFVERVPWVMHFQSRYALHGVFWHWGFGHKASHGCINLAPKDAAEIFTRVGPVLPQGWYRIDESPEEPGTLLRVRNASAGVGLKLQDRRVPLR
jgi:lipoprotein-anchoring transpeptidase ErfK/SrfK